MGLPLLHRGHSSPHLSRRLARVYWRGAEQQSDSWSHLGTGDCAPSVVRSIPWFWMGVFRYSIATECETLAFSFDRAFHLWAWSGPGTDSQLVTLVGRLDARCRSGIRQCGSIAHAGGLSYHSRSQRGHVLFARCWLVVERQTEYCLLPESARQLNLGFDLNGVCCVSIVNSNITPLFRFADDLDLKNLGRNQASQASKPVAVKLKAVPARG